MRNRARIARMKQMEPLPLPESLEKAFSEIEKPARFADSPRGYDEARQRSKRGQDDAGRRHGHE